jgi:hypothetical protein
MVLGPTAGAQYLAYIDFPDEHYYPDTPKLLHDLDDAILEAAEQVIGEWRRADPLLRALMVDDTALNTWAPYPAGQLPPGTLVRLTQSDGIYWEGTTTGRTHVRYPDSVGVEVVIGWTRGQFGWTCVSPIVTPETEIEAWVPVPCDLSAALAKVDGYPKPPAAPRKKKDGALRLSPTMLELLEDLVKHPHMYITNYTRWDRTAQALIARGLAEGTQTHGNEYELTITEEGRAEAVRQGIIADPAVAA